MKLKKLEELLGSVDGFEAPKILLEQYETGEPSGRKRQPSLRGGTGAHIAACMLHTAAALGDVEDRVVVDLGCGCGKLTLAAALLGAGHVLGVDVDQDALAIGKENASQFEPLPVDWLLSDVTSLPASLWAHTVVSNPPFGTRVKGADTAFLRAACSVASSAVYSLHKSSTRKHLERFVASTPGWSGKVCRAAFACFINPTACSLCRRSWLSCAMTCRRRMRFTAPRPST